MRRLFFVANWVPGSPAAVPPTWQVEHEVAQAQAAYEDLVRTSDRLAEEELIATAEDGFEFVSRHVSELSTALMVTQDLMMGLAELEHERERQLDQMYEASDRKLLAEAERLRREIGEGELRRTELQAMAGPTTRQTETVQLLEEESRQLEATLTELHATRAKLTTQLEESVSRRDEAQALSLIHI